MKKIISLIMSLIHYLYKILPGYRYVVSYHDCNGNRYELFFKGWEDANECARNAFNSKKSNVTLKIK